MLKQGLLHLDDVLKHLEPLHKPLEPPGGSVLLHELVSAPILSEATSNPQVYHRYGLHLSHIVAENIYLSLKAVNSTLSSQKNIYLYSNKSR